MKKILYIAKNELYTLFYSPIAWILMIVFLVLTSADYVGLIDNYTGMYERGGLWLIFVQNLTSNLTSNPFFGYLMGVIKNLYIFFPLITMGLISRELGSGTIKLLYSSPLKISEIVLGKYLAMIGFTLCLLTLLFLTLVGFSISVAHTDTGQLAASVFGLFLVLCTYSAIGLFISSLTSYQIVAAIITLAIFAFLGKIGDLWQTIGWVRHITYYMNIGAKSYNFIRGLMNLRDLCYFLILTISFLLFTIIRIKSATESISAWRKGMRYALVVLAAFVVGYITNKPEVNVYIDSTRNQLYTITPPTRQMLARLNDGDLEITAYANLLDFNFGRFQPSEQNNVLTNVWEPYIRFKPNIHLHFVYYYNNDTSSYYAKVNPGKSIKEIAEKECGTYGMTLDQFLGPNEVNRQVDTKFEQYRAFFVLRYKGRSAVCRVFDDDEFWPSENEIAATINRLIAVPPRVVFLSDEIERGPYSERTRDYKSMASRKGFRYALINQGYDFDTLSLKQRPIPDGIATLVLADPRTSIAAASLEKIDRYIDGGGNLLLLTEPDRADLTKPLLAKLGLSLRDGQVIQPNDNYGSDMTFPYLTDTAKHFSPQFTRTLEDNIIHFGDSFPRVGMLSPKVIEYKDTGGFHVAPLLLTDEKLSWNRLAPISSDSLQLKVPKLPGDETGRFATAVRMQRTIDGKEQRILVAGDADFLTDPQVFPSGQPFRDNFDFGFWCFGWFSYGQFPANTSRPRSLDSSFNITKAQVGIPKVIYYWLIPILLAVAGSVILIRRKRK